MERLIDRTQKKTRVYLSGPVTGTDDYIGRFKAAGDRLAADGMGVVNPALIMSNMPEDMGREEYMELSLHLIDMCDAVYMMEGWEMSCSANREYGYALASGMVISFEDREIKRG